MHKIAVVGDKDSIRGLRQLDLTYILPEKRETVAFLKVLLLKVMPLYILPRIKLMVSWMKYPGTGTATFRNYTYTRQHRLIGLRKEIC